MVLHHSATTIELRTLNMAYGQTNRNALIPRVLTVTTAFGQTPSPKCAKNTVSRKCSSSAHGEIGKIATSLYGGIG